MTGPTVVIPFRAESDGGESLRYALRSLANLPHGRAVVCGDAPIWYRGETVPRKRLANRYDDSEASVRAGLTLVGGWAYISHDDHMVMRPVEWIAPANRGLISRRGGGDYYDRARRAVGWLSSRGVDQPLNFNVHQPFLVNADRYLDLTDGAPTGFGLTAYGNMAGLITPTITDPKITRTGQRPDPSWPVISITDATLTGKVGQMLKARFTHASPYEG